MVSTTAIDGLVSLPATLDKSFKFFDLNNKIPSFPGKTNEKLGSGFCMKVCGGISVFTSASAFAFVLAGV